MKPKFRHCRGDGIRAKGVDDRDDGFLVHGNPNAIFYHIDQAMSESFCQERSRDMSKGMETAEKPYAEIAERLRWHRESITGLTQKEYAEKIGSKRPAYSQWEAGLQRLSLNGALALRKTYGLSLDFLYEGIDDALPMTLRNAWRDRPSVKS